MTQFYFDTCECDSDCLEQTLSVSGYNFHRKQNNLWHCSSDKLFIQIAHPYSENFKVKIDSSFDGVPAIEKDIINLAKLLRDVCKPIRIVGGSLNELNYETLQPK